MCYGVGGNCYGFVVVFRWGLEFVAFSFFACFGLDSGEFC